MAYSSNFNMFCQYCLNVRNLYACGTLADIKSEGVDGCRVNSPATGTNKTIKAATIIVKQRAWSAASRIQPGNYFFSRFFSESAWTTTHFLLPLQNVFLKIHETVQEQEACTADKPKRSTEVQETELVCHCEQSVWVPSCWSWRCGAASGRWGWRWGTEPCLA